MEFLQPVLDLLVSRFERVGLEMNMSKTQTMICTLDRIRTQLPTESYRWLRWGRVTVAGRRVECKGRRMCQVQDDVEGQLPLSPSGSMHDVY